MSLRNFYRKTTKIFKVELEFNDSVPELRADTMSFILKKRRTDLDSEAYLTSEADMITEGGEGKAIFTLESDDLDLAPGPYFYEIKWFPDSSEYVLDSGILTILDTVFD